MVKIFYRALLFVLVISPAIANAQSNYYIDEPKTFYAGFLAGANFTQVDGDNFSGYDKIGLNVGGIVYATLDDHVAASMEILYSQKGSRAIRPAELAGATGIFITHYGINLNYAEVPVLINYFDKRKSHFGGGFSYSQLATSSETLTTNPPTHFNLENYPFKKIDINIVLGGDIHLYKGLFLNIRFQYSLIPIRTTVPAGYSRAQQFNNLWVVRLMYLFI